ncbi:MAG: cytochrome c maturation protein CcmE [Myxococcota bacterium]
MTAEIEPRIPAEPGRKPKASANQKPSGYGLIVGIIVAIGIALVVFVTTSGGQSELTIGKVTAAPEKYENRKLRVVGTIKQGSTKSTTVNGKSETNFAIVDDQGNELRVVYRQALPDPYKEGRSAIVEGTYASAAGTSGLVEANKLTVKCPSKYQTEDGSPVDYEAYKKRYMEDETPATPGPRS